MNSEFQQLIEKKIKLKMRRCFQMKDIYICCFETYGRDDISVDEIMRNVVAFNRDGEVRWHIEDIKITDNLPEGAGAGYANVFIEEHKLWAYNFTGEAHQPDLKTGKVPTYRWMK